jgi:hypothetical protein
MLLSWMWFLTAGIAAAQETDTAFPPELEDSAEDAGEIIGTLSYLAEELSFTVDIRRAYLVPQTVYVGDMGRLTLHLEAYSGMFPFIRERLPTLPRSEALVISRLEMRKYEDAREPQKGYFQLLIDFTAYEPGTLSIPPFNIPAEEPNSGVFYVSGLSVDIASILTPSSMEISGPVPPLAVPGTSFLFYGTFAVVVLVCSSVIYFLYGRSGFRKIRAHLERRRLIRAMGKTIRRIGEAVLKKDAEGPDLTELSLRFSAEMRKTLTFLSALNCGALTAGEFLGMAAMPVADFYGFPKDEGAAEERDGGASRPPQAAPEPGTEAGEDTKSRPGEADVLSPPFLGRLFRRCDILRFSGKGMDTAEFLAILGDAGLFINALDRAEKERNSRLKHILRKDNAVYPVLKNERKLEFSTRGPV